MLKATISIVIGTYNRKDLLINSINSIRLNRINVPFEIIVVDGGSNDGTVQWLSLQKDIITIIQHNRISINGNPAMKRSWGYFMNLGFKASEGEYICMLSDDCYVHPEAIMNGYNAIIQQENERIGGCVFPFRNSLLGDEFMIYRTNDQKNIINYGFYKRSIIEQIGWADENNFKFYFSDIDLSLRILRSRYRIILSTNSLVEHLRNEFDPLRNINEMEKQNNQDFIHFKSLWSKDYDFSAEEAVAKPIALDICIPNEIYKYLPDTLTFKMLIFDRWIKTLISKDSVFYKLLKKCKWILFERLF